MCEVLGSGPWGLRGMPVRDKPAAPGSLVRGMRLCGSVKCENKHCHAKREMSPTHQLTYKIYYLSVF